LGDPRRPPGLHTLPANELGRCRARDWVARQRGLPADLPRWIAVRDRIYNQIIERGWHPSRRAFVQHYDSDVLDASLLLMPLCKFIAPTDPRWISTLDAITAELSPTASSTATT
jgi:GH15 family glucan-1,4-alpha-glucosidase